MKANSMKPSLIFVSNGSPKAHALYLDRLVDDGTITIQEPGPGFAYAIPQGEWRYAMVGTHYTNPKDLAAESCLTVPAGDDVLLTAPPIHQNHNLRFAIARHDADLKVVSFDTYSIDQLSDGVILRPKAGATGFTVGLRLEGAGTLPQVEIFAVTSNGASAATVTESAFAAANHLDQRRYWSALQVAEAHSGEKSLIPVRIRAAAELRAHSMLLDIHKRHPEFFATSRNQLRLLVAAGAEQAWDVIEAITEGILRQDQPSNTDVRSLVVAMKFARRHRPELFDTIFNRLGVDRFACCGDADIPIVLSYFLQHQRQADADRLVELWEASGGDKVRVALARSQLAFARGDYPLQLDHLNAALGLHGLSPLGLKSASRPLAAGNLSSRDTQHSVNGPSVSVVMTTFNSAVTLGYAVASILDQTHVNFELVVVDDGSTDDTPAMILELARRDPRILPVLLEANAGTYAAKNQGLLRAGGKYVVCQDSDDWAHPQKLERLVSSVETSGRPHQCQHIRVSELSGLSPRSGYLRPDASSLIFEREPSLAAIGYFDEVRAGADTEFMFRLEWATGRRVTVLPNLLSFVAQLDNSLSGAGPFSIDDETGAFAPARVAYRQAFQERHERGQLFVPAPPHRPSRTPIA